jgi:DNA repair protein RecO (recombination protein O)
MLQSSMRSRGPWHPGPVFAEANARHGDARLIRQRDEGFVLDTSALGEADLIVALFTEHHGKVRAVARAARRSRRRFGGLLEPLTRVRASWTAREGRELHQLDALEGCRSFAEMQADPLRQAACAVLTDVARAFSHEGQADPQQFRLLAAVLEALEQGGPPRSLLRYFEYWTLRVHGLLPDLAACAVCSGPLGSGRPLRVGARRGPLCDACPAQPGEREARLGGVEQEFLETVRRVPPTALATSGRHARAGAALEVLLRGALEAFAECSFRTYRHFKAQETPAAGGGTE